jgi:hypothetical protein
MSNLYDLLRRDVFDSRDILEKIDELKSEALSLKNEIFELRQKRKLSDVSLIQYQKKIITKEITILQNFKQDCENYTSEFESGATIISWRYFDDYCEEYAYEFGYISKSKNYSNPLYNCIDWRQWADFMRQDFAEVSCEGGNYFISSY